MNPKSITFWIKKNKKEFIIILFILLMAAFLRLYRIDEYMTFLGDEGRDALMIKRILTTFDIPLVGPPTSIGNMYLGPLYYYMMTIPMTIFWLNPVSAAVMVAFLGVASVSIIYYLSREWFGRLAAIISATLYSVSPVNIVYSRSSWNPNPAPFFALLIFLGFYKAHKTRNYKWFILSGVSFAFLIQMHYLAIILLPAIGIIWVYEYLIMPRQFGKEKNFFKGTLLGILFFLILVSPLFIFDLKHNFANYRAISTFFTNRETTVNLNILNTLGRIYPIYQNNLIGRYITGEIFFLNIVTVFSIVGIFIWVLIRRIKNQLVSWPFFALGIWLGVGVVGLSLYKQNIYDHYLGFLNPAPYLILGSLTFIANLSKYKRYILAAVLVLFGAILVSNLRRNPLQNHPNNQLKKTQNIAKFVISESQNNPFNFALIAKSNYDDAYEFYLDLYNHSPKQVPFDITDQLFVVCEDEECKPVGHPKYEIAAFGWTKIEIEKEFSGVKVFKLVHYSATND